ncbi:hypothetical protein D3C76_1428500 [compost metagenome]
MIDLGAKFGQFLGLLPQLFVEGLLFTGQPALARVVQGGLVLGHLGGLGAHFVGEHEGAAFGFC